MAVVTVETRRYSLLTEPWLPFRTVGGRAELLGITEALLRSPELASLAGDSATQDAGLTRLLLGIVRRIYPELRSATEWGRLWDSGHFDGERVRTYLEHYRDRFDLLHPETPFYQVAGLSTAKGEMTELARLIPDQPAGHPYFTIRAGQTLESMDLAEAARWVVHCQAWDPSGIKSGAVGDDRVTGGKGYPIGVGWCGWLGLIVVEGRNLFETLMLNLQTPVGMPAPDVDLPVWERPPQGPAIEAGHAFPTGPADLLTWQSRRIRLAHADGRATGVLIANGDPLHPRDQFKSEYMTNWRVSDAQRRALKSPVDVYMPRTHIAGRAVWRGLEALLATPAPGEGGITGEWLEWLSRLRVERVLPSSHPIQLHTVGLEYGAQSAVITDMIDDRLSLPLAVLTDRELKTLAIEAVHDAEHAAQTLGRLAYDLAIAEGASSELADVERGDAREETYSELDAPYRRWLARLDAAADLEELRAAWQRHVRSKAEEEARSLLNRTTREAWKVGDDTRGAAPATRWFYINLRRHLRYAYPDENGDAR